jgi:hypothetical protein
MLHKKIICEALVGLAEDVHNIEDTVTVTSTLDAKMVEMEKTLQKMSLRHDQQLAYLQTVRKQENQLFQKRLDEMGKRIFDLENPPLPQSIFPSIALINPFD